MLNRNTLLRLDAVLIAAMVSLRCTSALADGGRFGLEALEPTTVFVQAGAGDEWTEAYVAGATWDCHWREQYSFITASGYFEAAAGRWSTRVGGITTSAWATQVGLTPVIRLQPSGRQNNWFAELGVGANYIVPLFQNKRCSTEFNF